MTKKRSGEKRKRRTTRDSTIRVEEIGDRIIPFPSEHPPPDRSPSANAGEPPSRLTAEQTMHAFQQAIEGQAFPNEEELSEFVADSNRSGGRVRGKGTAKRSRKHEAQDLAYLAMETREPNESAAFAERALALDSDCVDAFVQLGRLAYEEADELIEHMRRAVVIGERGLGGKKYFDEEQGYFWGLLETRPYMRARAYLAQLLTEAGLDDEAVEQYEDMLRLNPNDNQGIRYPLLGLYLSAENLDGVRRLLAEYEDEGSAVLVWSLVLERFLSGDEEEAANALTEARQTNQYVQNYLVGRKRIPVELPGHYGFGDENEAIVCADAIGRAWIDHPKAVAWLKGV